MAARSWVVWVLAGSPADRAGVLVGDVIVSVDGAAVKGFSDATFRIRGASGTPVVLQLRRNGAPLTLRSGPPALGEYRRSAVEA